MEVAHHVAHLVGGNKHFNVVDRFENLRTCFLKCLAEGVATCQHEGEFVGVNRVHLSVVNDDANVASVTSGERSLFHATHYAFQNGGHEASVNGSAHNRVDEHEFAAPFQRYFFLALEVDADFLIAKLVNSGIGHVFVIRLNNEVNFTKLSGTTALLLVAIVSACSLGDCLTIRNALLIELDVDLIDVFETPLQGAQVELSLSVHQDLTQLLALFNFPSGVFLTHAVEGRHHLFGFGFVQGTDGTCILGVGIFNKVEAVVAVLAVERVARAHIFQFDGATDVAGLQTFHLLAVGSGTNKDLCHALFRTSVGIGQIVAFFQRSAHHLEVLHFTDVRFYTGLEEIDGSRSVNCGGHFHTACVVHRGHFVHERNHVAEEFHQTTHTHVFAGAHAEHGEDAARNHTLADTFAHLVFGEVFGFEEFFHQAFVVLGGSFHQHTVHGFCFLQFFGRNVLNGGFAAVGAPSELLHQNDVDEAVEIRTGGHGILHGNYL